MSRASLRFRAMRGAGLTLGLLALGCTVSHADLTYSVQGIGALGTDSSGKSESYAYGVNAAGQVVGYSAVYDAGHNSLGYSGILYQNGQITQLGNFGTDTTGYSESYAYGINASGQVAGYSSVYDAGHNYVGNGGFIYQNGQMTQLSHFGTSPSGAFNTVVQSINDKGQIAGYALVYDSAHKIQGYAGVVFDTNTGQTTQLGNLGTNKYGLGNSTAASINNAGQVTGYSQIYDSNHNAVGTSAFLWENGQMTNIGNLGTDVAGHGYSQGYAINDKGQIVGYSTAYSADHVSQGQAAFIFNSGKMTGLGSLTDALYGTDSLGDGLSVATGINNKGQVVGTAQIYDMVTHDKTANTGAFFYANGKMVDLNSVIRPNSGWVLQGAQAINDSGQIVGWGLYDGNAQGFILTPTTAPVPEVSDCIQMTGLLALGGLAFRRFRRK